MVDDARISDPTCTGYRSTILEVSCGNDVPLLLTNDFNLLFFCCCCAPSRELTNSTAFYVGRHRLEWQRETAKGDQRESAD